MTYILQPGDPQARPPYSGEGVLLHGGFLKCDGPALQQLCDLVLNQVDQELSFSVVGDQVLYAALYAQKMRSVDPRDARFGYVPESDVGLWILTWGGRKGRPPGLRWMPAFIFVDSPTALMTGRELYGYPKQPGRMTRSGVADNDFGVSLRAISFVRQDPNEQGRENEVLTVQPLPDPAASVLADSTRGELLSPFRKMMAAWAAEAADQPNWSDALSSLTPPFLGMPMVFLRQMRDVAVLDGILIQEVVTVTVQPTHIAGGGLAPGQELVLKPNTSFPIAKTLGCASTVLLTAGFWARFDFQVGLGKRL